MRYKTIIVYILVILFFPGIYVCAQDTESTTEGILVRMKAELNLTPYQADTAKPIIEEYTAKRHQARENLKEQGETDKNIIVSRMEQLREEESQKLARVLTPDQMKQWNKKQKVSNFLNKDQSFDTGWETKGSGIGVGTNF